MTLKEVAAKGFKEVYARIDGYQEGRIMPTWQPFNRTKVIKFSICPLRGGEYYLDHRTFILWENEDKLEYYEKEGKIYVDYPTVLCDRID